MQLRFRAVATSFPVQITTTDNKFKPGKNITISWDDFHDSGFYDIELYQSGYVAKSLGKSHRGTTITASLPKNLEKGTYEVRVTPSNREELYSDNYPVTINGGKGIFLIAGGALAAGAGVLVLGGGDEGGVSDSGLPDPPTPGGN